MVHALEYPLQKVLVVGQGHRHPVFEQLLVGQTIVLARDVPFRLLDNLPDLLIQLVGRCQAPIVECVL